MPTILLLMQRKAIIQNIKKRLDGDNTIFVISDKNYNTDLVFSNGLKLEVILIEVSESRNYDIEYCLILCEEIRKINPWCKLLLMVPEQNKNSVNLVVKAKVSKEIDDFVFYDVTIDYLVSKILSIW